MDILTLNQAKLHSLFFCLNTRIRPGYTNKIVVQIQQEIIGMAMHLFKIFQGVKLTSFIVVIPVKRRRVLFEFLKWRDNRENKYFT